MRTISLLYFLLSTAFVFAQDVTPDSVKQAFIRARIVPDVLDTFDPFLLLDVTYTGPGTGKQKAVTPPGKDFTKPETLNSPVYSIPSNFADWRNETFVVVMVNPDAPSPQHPIVSEVRHFVGADYRLQDATVTGVTGAVLVSNTPALSDYIQPAPPRTSDPHRYVWLLYHQPLDFPKRLHGSDINFSIKDFARKNKLGPPLAGNFMTVSTKSFSVVGDCEMRPLGMRLQGRTV